MRQAILWLASTAWTALSLTLEVSGPHDGFLRLFTVQATAFVKNYTVRVNDVRQNGHTCDGFVPTPLRWYGADGPGSELRSFQGRGTGARLRFEPGDYEVDLIVLAENVPPHPLITGVLRVGEQPDEVTLGRAGSAT